MTALKSWRERLATPLKAREQAPEQAESPQTKQTKQTPDFLRVGLLAGESTNHQQTPVTDDVLNVRSDVRTAARLVRTGPNTWAEADWARGLCVMCPEPLMAGDVIACAEHRRQMDALEMPWDVKS